MCAVMSLSEAFDVGYVDLLLDSCRGIHQPHDFATEVYGEGWSGADEDDLATLRRGADEEFYWDAWDSVLSDAQWTDNTGHGWHLWQDGDVLLIRDDVDLEG